MGDGFPWQAEEPFSVFTRFKYGYTLQRCISSHPPHVFQKDPLLLSSLLRPPLQLLLPPSVSPIAFFPPQPAFKLVCLPHLRLSCYFHRRQSEVECMLIQIWDHCPSLEIVDRKQLEHRNRVDMSGRQAPNVSPAAPSDRKCKSFPSLT